MSMIKTVSKIGHELDFTENDQMAFTIKSLLQIDLETSYYGSFSQNLKDLSSHLDQGQTGI